jgi:hypothetical protein
LHLNYDRVEAKSYLSHCPHVDLTLSLFSLPPFLRRHGRASIFAPSLRKAADRKRSSGFSTRALSAKCRAGHFGETNPTLSNAGTSSRSPRELRRLFLVQLRRFLAVETDRSCATLNRVLATATLAAPCGNRFAKLIGCCWTLRPRGCRPLHDVEATRPSHTGVPQRQISVRSGGKC